MIRGEVKYSQKLLRAHQKKLMIRPKRSKQKQISPKRKLRRKLFLKKQKIRLYPNWKARWS
jgi:hypothetical protein